MKNKIITSLKESLNKLNIEKEIELTPSEGHGDFSTNIAMKLARELKKSPQIIANEIIEGIELEKFDIEKIEIAGPGFINFFMKREALNQIIKEVLKKGDDFGRGNQNQFINVEYVSANPTGYLHLGHARGAVVGSVLVNILRFAGNKVDAEYYVNDAGTQIDILGEATYIRYLNLFEGNKKEMPENTYRGEDIIWVAKKLKEKVNDKYLNLNYEDCKEEIKLFAKDLLLNEIDKDLKRFGVKMDFFSSEQDLYDKNLITPALNKLKDKFEKDGATWLETTKYGDDKDRVLIKSDGKYTYFTPDIAYHEEKLKRGYTSIINIWGADHIGYIKRMEVALESLGYPKGTLKNTLVIQLVKLIKDNKELKMSKRLGTSFTLREIIDMVGKDAARFFMINRSCDSKFDFDLDLANQKTSDNPIFYIQYAHARINQILNKSNKKLETEKLETKGAEELMNMLTKFPSLVIKIADNQKVHLLAQYVLKLAKSFHSYYNNEKIIGSEHEASKLTIIKAVKQVIKNGLSLLGIEAPERM
ncbi:MAG: arginine--tRNA ligase [Mycoplasma sp.]|nr:arginine--tRNA ligase [Mycoplasma sp.]